MSTIAIRSAVASDRAYLLDSFVRGYRASSFYADGVDANVLGGLIDPLLALWDVAVAVDPASPDTLLGWICWSGRAVAWLNVRGDFRRRGIGRVLLSHAGIDVGDVAVCFLPTAIDTEAGRQDFSAVARRKGYRLRFRPYLPLSEAAGGA
jgi:GNAT superfamily N-acetyltransferase